MVNIFQDLLRIKFSQGPDVIRSPHGSLTLGKDDLPVFGQKDGAGACTDRWHDGPADFFNLLLTMDIPCCSIIDEKVLMCYSPHAKIKTSTFCIETPS